jgi:hypothetical protein
MAFGRLRQSISSEGPKATQSVLPNADGFAGAGVFAMFQPPAKTIKKIAKIEIRIVF